MKKIFQILLCLIIPFTALAQTQKDSITNNKHQRFIGFNVGGGLGLRKYKNVPDSLIKPMGEVQKGETLGSSFVFACNYDQQKKRWCHSFSLQYDYAQYKNDNVKNGTLSYKYRYTHQFLSSVYSFYYYIGKNQNWKMGVNFKLGWLIRYSQMFYDLSSTNPWTNFENKTNQLKISPFPTVWAGVVAGRKLFETQSLRMFLDVHFDISSLVGYSKINVGYYVVNPAQRDVWGYEANPRMILLPTVQFKIQHKL